MGKVDFDNRISWMDIVTLLSAAGAGLYIIFGLQSDIALAQADRVRIESDYKAADIRIEHHVDQVSLDSKARHTLVLEEVQVVRKENKEGFDKLDGKIDQLINRELDSRPR